MASGKNTKCHGEKCNGNGKTVWFFHQGMCYFRVVIRKVNDRHISEFFGLVDVSLENDAISVHEKNVSLN